MTPLARASARSSGRGRCSLDSRTWEAGGWGRGQVRWGLPPAPCALSGSTHRVRWKPGNSRKLSGPLNSPLCPVLQIPPPLLGAAEPLAPFHPEAGGIAEVSKHSLVRKGLEKGEECGLVSVTRRRLPSWVTVSGTHISCLRACGIFNTKDNRLANSRARRGVRSPGLRAGLALGTGETHLSHSARKNGRGSCLVSEWSRVAGEQALSLGARARDRSEMTPFRDPSSLRPPGPSHPLTYRVPFLFPSPCPTWSSRRRGVLGGGGRGGGSLSS